MDPRSILKPRCSKPKAEELAKLFIEYCEVRQAEKLPLTKLSFYVYLGISKETYHFWKDEKQNKYLTDTEFQDRLTLIKKIETAMESDLADEMTKSKYPTGMIFTLKNTYGWTDRPEPEVSLNLQVDGYKMPQPERNNRAIETNSETNDRKPLQ